MLSLRIEYLTDRCVATAYNDRREAEWPPHPARVFSALVAAHCEADERSKEERRALEWLEAVGAPAITASDASRRTVVSHFVPVNDTTAPRVDRKAAAVLEGGDALRSLDATAVATAVKALDGAAVGAQRLLPERRKRQERHFPSVTPEDPVVHFSWDADPEPSVRATLAHLASRVVAIGHSSSLVRCTLDSSAPTPRYVPTEDGARVLRVVGPGQLARLDEAFERHQGTDARVMPCLFQRYSDHLDPTESMPRTVMDDREWIVFQQVGGPSLPMTAAVGVAAALRGAILRHGSGPLPASVSGHGPDGSATTAPHLAFVPLPFVGHRHADGRLLGIALVPPRGQALEERMTLFAALDRWERQRREELGEPELETPPLRLQLGAAGVLEIERFEWDEPERANLRSRTWCRPAQVWASSTPIALDRNPGDLRAVDPRKRAAAIQAAEDTLSSACERVGLPAPFQVEVLSSVALPGSAKARAFPRFPSSPAKTQRLLVHARVAFSEPVRGPILLGAGRHLGLGLMRPVSGGGSDEGR